MPLAAHRPDPMPPVALVSCMRNEGIHILEWLAYHKVIGFGPMVICTNDCADGSDTLLDLLASHELQPGRGESFDRSGCDGGFARADGGE